MIIEKGFNLPNLNTFLLYDFFFGSHKTLNGLLEFLLKNPQIKDLSIRIHPLLGSDGLYELYGDGLYKLIDNHLPNLVHIDLSCDFDDPQINDCQTIKNIKNVTLHSINGLIFNKLDELKLIRLTADIPDIFQFIYRNQNLKKLTVMLRYAMDDPIEKADFFMLAQNLPDLTEISMDWDIIPKEHIARFLIKCKSLKIFRVLLYEQQNFAEYTSIDVNSKWKIAQTILRIDHAEPLSTVEFTKI